MTRKELLDLANTFNDLAGAYDADGNLLASCPNDLARAIVRSLIEAYKDAEYHEALFAGIVEREITQENRS